MMRKITILLAWFSVLVPSTYAVETLVVDSLTRAILNTGAISYAPGQLQVNGVAVVPGGGGVGGGVTSISLSFPGIFVSPLTYTDDGAANWSATATFATVPANTFFGNGTASPGVPTFMDATAARIALSINNLDNTSDLNKPISTAQATVNTSMQGDILSNGTAITTINTTLGNLKLNTVAAPAADVSLAGFKITNLGDPTSATDAANKSYVDTAANAGPPHAAVAVASTGNLTLSGEQTIDGVTTSASRVLVKDQSTASQNGIYVTAAGAWSRAADANTGTSVSGIVFVSGGTTQTATSWGVTTPQPITLGTTGIAYTLTGTGGTTYTAGTGLTLAGNQFKFANIATGNVLGNNSGGSAAPTVQPATTVGFNFLGLTNPSAITFPRINADNTVTARSAANFLTDIGAGTVTSVAKTQNNSTDLLSISVANPTAAANITIDKANAAANTFYGNSTGSSAAPTFMAAATARTSLGGTTLGQNVFTLTNPSAITFPRFNSDNTVSALPASTFLSAIGGSAVDSAVLFGNTSPVTWTAGATAALETEALTSTDRLALLPPAAGYPAGRRIIYTDTLTTGSFGRTFRRTGLDTLNGGAADFQPFIGGHTGVFGGKSVEFENVAGTGWQVVSPASSIQAFQDPTFADKLVNVSVAGQTRSAGPYTLQLNGAADMGAVINTPAAAHAVITGYDITTNSLTNIVLTPSFLVPQSDHINSTTSPFTATNDGSTDSVWLDVTLTAPMVIHWPSANQYSATEPVTFFDSSGSINTVNTVTINSSGTDTFNGQSSLVLTNPYEVVQLRSNGAGNWSYRTLGGSTGTGTNVGGFVTLTDAGTTGGAVAWTCDQSLTKQKAVLTMNSSVASRVINISNMRDGEEFYLKVVQSSAGSGTLTVKNGATPSNGLGVITLSPGANAVDTIAMVYNQATGNFLIDNPTLNLTAPAIVSCTTAGDTFGASPNVALANGSTSGNKYTAAKMTFTGGFCRIDVTMKKTGSPTGLAQLIVFNDSGSGPGTTQVAISQTVAASSLASPTAAPVEFDLGSTIAAGTYYVAISNSQVNNSNYINESAKTGITGGAYYTSSNGTTWTLQTGSTAGSQFTATAYH